MPEIQLGLRVSLSGRKAPPFYRLRQILRHAGGAILCLVAILYFLRVLNQWSFIVEQRVIPLWMPWIGIVIPGWTGNLGRPAGCTPRK